MDENNAAGSALYVAQKTHHLLYAVFSRLWICVASRDELVFRHSAESGILTTRESLP